MVGFQKKLSTFTDEMEDSDVLKAINSGNGDRKKNVSFIFTLKNRVGGLARALRVFQV